MSIYHKENRFIDIIAYYAIMLEEYEMDMHQHDRFEIMYVAKGRCFVAVEEEEFSLQEGKFIFIDQNISHKMWLKKGERCHLVNLEFRCHMENGLFDTEEIRKKNKEFTIFLKKKQEYGVLNDNHNLGYALKDLIAELQNSQKEKDFLLNLLFQRMLVELSRCVADSSYLTGITYIKKACRFIEENLSEPLKVSDIAECVQLNTSYLQSLFHKYLNCGVIGYVNRKRMEQASFLLENSTLSIIDIGFQIGYNSRQHFAYTFEKQYEMSPLKYRQLHGKPKNADTNNLRVEIEKNGKKNICAI